MSAYLAKKFAALRVGIFLATRYLRRTGKWQTGLVIFVMTLTFLNLVVTTGILVGLIAGAEENFIRRYAGDVLISKLPSKQYIERSAYIETLLSNMPEVVAVSPRYSEGGTIEAGYQRSASLPNALPDSVGVEVVGINLTKEAEVTDIHKLLVEGTFLETGDEDAVVLGAYLVDRYFPAGIGLATLSNVYAGDKVRLTMGNITRDVTVKGIIKTKTDAADLRVYMLDDTLRKFIGRTDFNVDEIAVRLTPEASPEAVTEKLVLFGVGSVAQVRPASDALGEFLDDIKNTFSMLGNIIGLVSVVVASITIFIIIFITAITRRKFIGILKAIGVTGGAIELSYMLLSLFYSVLGVGIGLLILYGVLVPYIDANPINFPFSDGTLAVTPIGTATRSVLILITTLIAGLIPAMLIVRKNTLDAILGR